jgi:transcriptional regulator of acetoin/glycerol metabolism
MTLEEARALRLLADRIGALFAISSALARSRQRESALLTRVLEAERQFGAAQSVISGQEVRQKHFAETLARPLLAHAYSPALKLMLIELERRAKRSEAMLLGTPSGVDPLPWAAAAHQLGTRPGGPLLLLDAAAEVAARSLEDPTAYPWRSAWGGTVFIRDIQLLPAAALTDLLVMATESQSAPTEIAQPLLIGSVEAAAARPEGLAQGSLLGQLFKTSPLLLPTLTERAEDLRSLVLDALARHPRGTEPVGIERRALQLLMDHDWPGNERELNDVIERALVLCEGPLLNVDDLSRARFAPAVDLTHPDSDPAQATEESFARTPSGPPRRRSRSTRPRARS